MARLPWVASWQNYRRRARLARAGGSTRGPPRGRTSDSSLLGPQWPNRRTQPTVDERTLRSFRLAFDLGDQTASPLLYQGLAQPPPLPDSPCFAGPPVVSLFSLLPDRYPTGCGGTESELHGGA